MAPSPHTAALFSMRPPGRIPRSCPLGADECPFFAELQRLQEECQRLYQLSQTDPLTGLYNFRYFLSALEQEMERTRRSGLPTGLIMMDLDFFKRVNDNYGHRGGDEALCWACKTWGQNIRRIDILCRYGGEEFVLILPGTRLPQAIRTAERLRVTLAESPVELNGQPVTITASMGVDIYVLGETLSAEAFIHRTDQYLLEAKGKGRNRVCHRALGVTGETEGITTDERSALFDLSRE